MKHDYIENKKIVNDNITEIKDRIENIESTFNIEDVKSEVSVIKKDIDDLDHFVSHENSKRIKEINLINESVKIVNDELSNIKTILGIEEDSADNEYKITIADLYKRNEDLSIELEKACHRIDILEIKIDELLKSKKIT